VRKIVLLTAIAAMSITAVAYAIEDTLTYTGAGSHKGTPTKAKPANLSYLGTLHIDTNPPGMQPETAPSTSVFFASFVKNNGAAFPSCDKSEIDGQATISAKCEKARVSVKGKSHATAYLGTPGQPLGAKQDLEVEAYNGPSGKVLYLVVNNSAVQHRVIPGTVVKASGKYGFLVRFDIPPELQQIAGVKISLTDFAVYIDGKPRKVKVGKKTVSESFLTITSCPGGKLPSKAITTFIDSDTSQPKPVTSETVGTC
jgi:hypothetical protein